MVCSDYTERRILFYSQNYKRPATQKSIYIVRSYLTPALITAQRALKFYLTVYTLKKRRRSFHTVALPFFLNDATV